MTSTNLNCSNLNSISSFREDFLSAHSFSGNDTNQIVSGEYELAVFAISWDYRCLSLAKGDRWRAERCVVIRPLISDASGISESNEKSLLSLLKSRCDQLEIIDGPGVGAEGVWDRLYEIALGIAARSINSNVFLFDLSAMSRYYSMGLVGMAIRLGITARIDCFYAEGKYDAKHNVSDVVFAGGKWERKTIPFLDGIGNPSLGWYYLVSTGFDGKWIKKLLLQEEPDRVGLLTPIPGVFKPYEQRCLDEIKPIVEEFAVPAEFQLKAHASDAVDAWRKISQFGRERWNDEQVAYLCCGTKPHALAMALRSLVHRSPAVLYFRPEKYTVIPVEEAGIFWKYSILDHSALNYPKKASNPANADSM